MGKLSRTKGAAFEREVANLLKEIGLDARRNVQETQLGNNGDVLVSNFPIEIQAKVGMRPPLFDALDEAEAVCQNGRVPLVFARRNQSRHRAARDCVMLRTEDFLRILRALFLGNYDIRSRADG